MNQKSTTNWLMIQKIELFWIFSIYKWFEKKQFLVQFLKIVTFSKKISISSDIHSSWHCLPCSQPIPFDLATSWCSCPHHPFSSPSKPHVVLQLQRGLIGNFCKKKPKKKLKEFLALFQQTNSIQFSISSNNNNVSIINLVSFNKYTLSIQINCLKKNQFFFSSSRKNWTKSFLEFQTISFWITNYIVGCSCL